MKFLIALAVLTLQVTFTSRTIVVIVPVTVTDERGRVVSGLTKDRFRLLDEGREQVISMFEFGDSPVTLGLVVDASASMRPKLAPLREAIDAFARTTRPDDELFLVHFNDRVTRATLTAGPFTSDPADLRTAIAAVRPSGTTALWDGVSEALRHLRLGGLPRKALVVVSDGGDNASRATSEQVLAEARRLGALAYTLGLSADAEDRRSNAELARLAVESGGRSFLPGTSANIAPALAAIARDLRQQYVLGFRPDASDSPATVRRLQVVVNDPARRRLTIRSRTSYATPDTREP